MHQPNSFLQIWNSCLWSVQLEASIIFLAEESTHGDKVVIWAILSWIVLNSIPICVVVVLLLLFVNAKQHLAVLSFWGQESGSRTQGGNFSRPTITLAADKPNLLINALGTFPSFTTKESTSPFRVKRLTFLANCILKIRAHPSQHNHVWTARLDRNLARDLRVTPDNYG